MSKTTGKAVACFKKLRYATAMTEPARQALRIARTDAESVYRDLSVYRIAISLEENGWLVDYGTAILSCPPAALKLSRQGDVQADISN